jgi:hypothetical protein
MKSCLSYHDSFYSWWLEETLHWGAHLKALKDEARFLCGQLDWFMAEGYVYNGAPEELVSGMGACLRRLEMVHMSAALGNVDLMNNVARPFDPYARTQRDYAQVAQRHNIIANAQKSMRGGRGGGGGGGSGWRGRGRGRGSTAGSGAGSAAGSGAAAAADTQFQQPSAPQHHTQGVPRGGGRGGHRGRGSGAGGGRGY